MEMEYIYFMGSFWDSENCTLIAQAIPVGHSRITILSMHKVLISLGNLSFNVIANYVRGNNHQQRRSAYPPDRAFLMPKNNLTPCMQDMVSSI